MSDPKKFDVVEISIAEPNTVRVLASGKSERAAEAIERMVIMRRGVETHFYSVTPSGKFSDGDLWVTP